MWSRSKLHVLAVLAAVGGGILGVFGAIFQEIFYGSIFAAFIAGPMIEEVMKPTGVYLLFVLKRDACKGRVHTALLAALGGLTFALVENLFYLMVYFPEHSHAVMVVRYTWALGLHTTASFIVGLGINENLIRSIKGDIPLLKGNWRFFVIPMVLHSIFNVAMVLFGKRWV